MGILIEWQFQLKFEFEFLLAIRNLNWNSYSNRNIEGGAERGIARSFQPSGLLGLAGVVFDKKTYRCLSSGRHASVEIMKLIARIDHCFDQMLCVPGKRYMARGPDWGNLPTYENSRGSRFDNLVAWACGCGPEAVREIRQRADRAKFFETDISVPRKRGVVPGRGDIDLEDLLGVDQAGAGGDDRNEEEIALGTNALPSDPLDQIGDGRTELANVRGQYFDSAANNPQAHATGLILGRMYSATISRSIEGSGDSAN